MKRSTRLLVFLLSLGLAPAAGAAPLEFALIGDVPYGDPDPVFRRTIRAINAAKPAWVIHNGDIKGGHSPCSDAMFKSRLALFQTFEPPFILTPGDNEWTDCHRPLAGGYAPLERLAKLREIFYPQPGLTLGGRPMKVTTQADQPAYAEFPENVRWEREGVVFVGLHLVGSFNGLNQFPGWGKAEQAESRRRTKAALAWMGEAFALARKRDSAGVFVFMQANPGFNYPANSSTRRAFNEFLIALRKEVEAFGKPVLLAHGDTHRYRLDQPLRRPDGSVVKNFTRVENFAADPYWIRIRVDPKRPEVFQVTPEVVVKVP